MQLQSTFGTLLLALSLGFAVANPCNEKYIKEDDCNKDCADYYGSCTSYNGGVLSPHKWECICDQYLKDGDSVAK
ncbi:Uu.00g089360.m01.CDS01 [Anthostomella pinea]|uniref:Uu.00g089360.m01.CDS01 n=1 Tax=Anthostomella pinea TaxID=933095 RepID=A0AAI8VNV8_9PEZI|nr:Uu.00g089360.m01.CDS01 [Anthostomella pinea]